MLIFFLVFIDAYIFVPVLRSADRLTARRTPRLSFWRQHQAGGRLRLCVITRRCTFSY